MSTKYPGQFTPFAAFLAWAWPGLGHISLGERKRGMLVMFGVLFLFVSGVLIGGVDVVDHEDDTLWFVAQALCGPVALATDLANQRLIRPMPGDWKDRYEQGDPEIMDRIRRKSLGHVNEMGTLYCALAGLMNLVVILDALQPPQRRRGRNAGSSEA
ncbi:MAG: DUF6677 family protein [Planctomycetota bacterium]